MAFPAIVRTTPASAALHCEALSQSTINKDRAATAGHSISRKERSKAKTIINSA